MTILFESYFFPDSLLEEYKSKSKVALDFAAHNLCKALYMGFKANGVNIRVVNAPNIGSFPAYYKSPFVPGGKLENGVSLPFINIAYFKRSYLRKKLFKTIKEELQSLQPSEETTLLLYNFRCLPLLPIIKEKWPWVKIVMIVTDLPWNTSMAPSKLTRLGKKIVGTNNRLDSNCLQTVDGFVLLAPKMREALHVENKPWCHMEGIYESDTQLGDIKKESENVILYTGNLGKKYGIIDLLDAFEGIDDNNYRLWFRGGGDCKDEILKRSEKDCRIKLFPQLSREDLLKLQKQATILVNPVSPSLRFTDYFFPSKTLEYLASGTPVVMQRLSCIPKEYDEFIYYIDDDTVDGMRKKIIEICSMPKEYLAMCGEKAAEFIFNNKTPKPQTGKIIEFINGISL